MRTMTRSELIATLASRFPALTATDAEVSVAAITGAISSALIAGHRVEIRGFGSFGLNYRPAKVGRNPKTGDPVSVPAKYHPHFKPGKEMRGLVDGKGRLLIG